MGELHSLKTPEEPWQEISINIIKPLPKSDRKDAIVVIVDQFTKIIWLKATTTSVSSEEITKIYQNKIWKLHRIPWTVPSNREPQSASKFMEDLMKALETKQCYDLSPRVRTEDYSCIEWHKRTW